MTLWTVCILAGIVLGTVGHLKGWRLTDIIAAGLIIGWLLALVTP